jgi:hypothetical protein
VVTECLSGNYHRFKSQLWQKQLISFTQSFLRHRRICGDNGRGGQPEKIDPNKWNIRKLAGEKRLLDMQLALSI